MYSRIPKEELDERIRRLQERLQPASIDGALIIQRADLFYFSGTTQQSHLYVPASGAPLLMVRKSFSRARDDSALESVVPLGSLRRLAEILAEHSHTPKRLGLEMDVVPANLYFYYSQRIFPETEIIDVSPMIRQIRAVKSRYEVGQIREAARRLDQTVRQVPQLVRPGISQLAFAGQLEAAARTLGHPGEIWMRHWNQRPFYGETIAGPEAALPSYFDGPLGGRGVNPAMPVGPTETPLQRGEPIIVDFIFVHNGYIADQTRTFALSELNPALMAAYEAMVEIQEAVVDAAGPGVTGGELYAIAIERAQAMGYAENFMGYGEGQVPFIGHGIGLEIDELPLLARGVDTSLEPGMVFALEPKVIFPGQGAIGIENDWLVTENRVECLTISEQQLQII